MRVVLVSKALVVGAYQRKAEEIARLGVDLTVLVPPYWQDRRGRQEAQPCHTQGYIFRVIPLRFNGDYHLHHYPTLARELAQLRPHLVHMDEEPYNLATWLGLRAANKLGAAGTFFTWQNLYRRYPYPFRWLERANYRLAPLAIAGNQEACRILRRKGYKGEIAVIPQFGVDPTVFAPSPSTREPAAAVRIGYAGGLLPEKGIDLLLRACAGLQGAWQLDIAGGGSEEQQLRYLAQEVGIAGQVHWCGPLASTQMPAFYQNLDLFVLPSRTTPTWKEQFGRVLIEAMACGVPVIGSDCGEIPQVIGDAGLIFGEGDSILLQGHLQRLLDRREERNHLGDAGRRRVLARYTMTSVAEQTVAAYKRLLAGR
ncbi:MAG: glycosyl transferase family 1 [Chloroflexi bacterium]|nr:MAG: glycosyl transferase family 1 [Chloroflexota bacterium]